MAQSQECKKPIAGKAVKNIFKTEAGFVPTSAFLFFRWSLPCLFFAELLNVFSLPDFAEFTQKFVDESEDSGDHIKAVATIHLDSFFVSHPQQN
ncbi:MAG: hypothetical protein L3J49_04455 [Desulfobulbaceae bacterium]|nr:hypothetical protein [Desulfobulbaceae bacterium]